MALPFLSVDQVIERALILIRNSELFKNPRVLDSSGKPVFINKLRDFDGFDANLTGLTLSIYPYSYQGTSNETVNSTNAALVWDDFEPGSMNPKTNARERLKLSLVVSISTLGFEQTQEISDLPATGEVIFERSGKERLLYAWLTDVREILLSNPISNLGGLISGSKVNWGTFHSTAWDKKDHAVIHKATLLWHMDLFTVRNYQNAAGFVNVPDVGPQLTWLYVGVRRSDQTPVYWDSTADMLMNQYGLPLLVTPTGKRVTWDSVNSQFIDPVTRLTLPPADLQDPVTLPLGPWIDTTLQIVAVMLPSKRNLYWNKVLMQLQLADGTVITELEDGTPVKYDPATGNLINSQTNVVLTVLNSTAFLSVKQGRVSIYDANTLKLKDQFLL